MTAFIFTSKSIGTTVKESKLIKSYMTVGPQVSFTISDSWWLVIGFFLLLAIPWPKDHDDLQLSTMASAGDFYSIFYI